ncbi:UNVERIFIED_CONTAM: hypothetical protein Scaly_2442800 [Sesamum calycinum]|uniref:Uncharacterized protein n=1 Tax=Sesamum calycinum TaxID=2727403 RepID=A0AAW2LQM3_9LAMI
MDRCPWNFDKNILILNEVDPDDNPHDIDLNWCAFFIQVQGLPLRQMTSDIAQYIGNRLGKFIEVDQGVKAGLDDANSSTTEWCLEKERQALLDIKASSSTSMAGSLRGATKKIKGKESTAIIGAIMSQN